MSYSSINREHDLAITDVRRESLLVRIGVLVSPGVVSLDTIEFLLLLGTAYYPSRVKKHRAGPQWR